MPIETFRQEKARVALAKSTRIGAVGIATSGSSYPVLYKLARKLALQLRGQIQGSP
eukprot:CAMPEP_0198217718 /NCGR_PEP_ID=MMETSP1445-20131203/65456_1 /TAXON_ID=36898 /ORGANISM="Pyramimonas sp., Strain CCMP2087" /LENGTH=55 /DNA_ID=CAMNT_0043894507 /DNA_START=60 /DNA_END=223 /DNA_ORIENTATION=+